MERRQNVHTERSMALAWRSDCKVLLNVAATTKNICTAAAMACSLQEKSPLLTARNSVRRYANLMTPEAWATMSSTDSPLDDSVLLAWM
eukprot:CAMPEP_0198505846 /NCGR_PEP_ID=MMETSP1462-20131121/11292_1 /TAXON_ID=1333877 /ORGANISM="Brandtodinium nutriculum, Strain RCC3387" /LENGTH=88 /DNA_ID=CAMNT_0044235041 /DNA_START=17 /DNA_END=283 /DNA_ORIENTATION=+